MLIASHTELLGVMGHPIGHSKSPDMHNRALTSQQLPYVYLSFDIIPEQLSQAVAGMRVLGARGWNVTIPHKVAIMAFLDEIDDDARQIGAVNTVVREGEKLIGYNTDAPGYLRSLQDETGLDVRGQQVLLIGAGGAARGVGYALAKAGAASITIVNRTFAKADQLAHHLSQWAPASAVPIEQVDQRIGISTLIVNTTSVGMFPHVDISPLHANLLKEGTIVSDLIYNPRQTKLLQEAEANGCVVHGGLGMFVHQGAIAYEKWTDHLAPLDVMWAAADGLSKRKAQT